jgi:hypothetical protein
MHGGSTGRGFGVKLHKSPQQGILYEDKWGVLVQGIHESHRPSRLINIDPMDYIRDLYGGFVLDLLLWNKIVDDWICTEVVRENEDCFG